MMTMLKILTNPATWIVLVIIVLISFAQVNRNLNHKVDKLEVQNAQLVQQTKDLEANVEIVKGDTKSLEKLIAKRQVVVQKQTEIIREINEIPDTSIEKPFQNLELYEAAVKFREYQKDAIK